MEPNELVIQYTPRSMLEMLEQKAAPASFLQRTFVKREITHDTTMIQIDVEKNGQQVAAYVSRCGTSNRLTSTGYGTQLHCLPYTDENERFTCEDLDTRLPGESVFSASSPQDRLDTLIAKTLRKLRDRVNNLKELQLSQTLQTGTAVVAGEGVNYVIDFQMNAGHIFTNVGAAAWDQTTSTKEADLREMALLPGKVGGRPSNICIMGLNAGVLFSDDEDVRAKLDNKNYNVGEIDFKQNQEEFATYIGRYKGVGFDLEIWTYQQQYQDAAGDYQYYLDPDVIIMGSTAARVETHYGRIDNMNSKFIGAEYPSFVVDKDRGKWADLYLETSPLVAVHSIDDFTTRRVV